MNASTGTMRFADALHVARNESASDVHFEPGSPPALRVDGELTFLPGPPLDEEETRTIAHDLAGAHGIAEVESGKDVSAIYVHEGMPLRVHVFRTRMGVVLAIRLLRGQIPSLESLHLPPVVASFAQRSRGLIVFAGPTGSGKSTSMAALVDTINSTRGCRIITVEDPIEYRHESKRSLVAQRELGSSALSFGAAITGALRADPDVIMIGEMRDQETMRTALVASETGHLVVSTLHTGDAPQTVDRIVDAFAGSQQAQIRTQLSQVLVGVVCQRLIPRAQGRRGRRVAAEVLVATDAVRNLIREGRSHQLRNAIMTGRQAGMQTLEDHLSALIASGEIDPVAAAAASLHRDEIQVRVHAGVS